MIIEATMCVINTIIAWGFALLFIRRRRAQMLFDALLGAAVHGILYYMVWLSSGDFRLVGQNIGFEKMGEQFSAGIQLLCFVMITVVVQFQQREDYGNSMIAFWLAQATYGLLSIVGKGAVLLGGELGIGYYLFCVGVFLWITFGIRKHFPAENWREYYTNSTPEPEQIGIQKWQIYGLTILIGVSVSCGMWYLTPDNWIEYVVISAGIFLGFWCGIILLILMQAYKKERIEVLIEHQYRNEMQSFMNVIRSQRHDYNFHVQTIAGLIREGNTEECLKYVDALEKDSALMNSILPVKDPAISAMIHNFQMLAAREGIQLYIDIQNDLSQVVTNVYETNKIISNLLQNAIDETKTHSDKSYGIHLTILKRGEYCVIRVTNEVPEGRMDSGEITKIYCQGYTTKQGHDGVGLSSIKTLASRYRGMVYTQMEGNYIVFVAKIPMNFVKGKEM